MTHYQVKKSLTRNHWNVIYRNETRFLIKNCKQPFQYRVARNNLVYPSPWSTQASSSHAQKVLFRTVLSFLLHKSEVSFVSISLIQSLLSISNCTCFVLSLPLMLPSCTEHLFAQNDCFVSAFLFLTVRSHTLFYASPLQYVRNFSKVRK